MLLLTLKVAKCVSCNGGYSCFHFYAVAKAVVFVFMRYLVAMAVVVAVFVFMRCCGGCFFRFRFHAVLW